MAAFQPLAPEAASVIATYSLTSPNQLHIEVAQAAHRIRLLNHWQIPPGSRVLEIGCGQGNCTTVLAEAVGPEGHVDAVDPGSPDYGSPFTLREAQEHISQSKVGDRVSWHCIQPMEFLQVHGNETWDYAVFSHCIWYFDEPNTLGGMLQALKCRVKEVLIAEYALTATEKAAEPHVLAAVARATLEAYNHDSEANIRCLLSPQAIKDISNAQGWNINREEVVVPDAGLLDGRWEVGSVKSSEFLEEIDISVKDAKISTVLRSSRDAIISAIEKLDGEDLRTMDVWVARLNC
ncbi:putative SAM-dependent methyltransferase [Thelonectria olida]|uniref:SAM-dependent methyltransferase n=1 Tax=Thelonectria olida TaxID=1576542 RepID=A0A9P8W3M2_9HYPO|nr:putative SAM-dependent methyltransferase [Thelonectria olida]